MRHRMPVSKFPPVKPSDGQRHGRVRISAAGFSAWLMALSPVGPGCRSPRMLHGMGPWETPLLRSRCGKRHAGVEIPAAPFRLWLMAWSHGNLRCRTSRMRHRMSVSKSPLPEFGCGPWRGSTGIFAGPDPAWLMACGHGNLRRCGSGVAHGVSQPRATGATRSTRSNQASHRRLTREPVRCPRLDTPGVRSHIRHTARIDSGPAIFLGEPGSVHGRRSRLLRRSRKGESPVLAELRAGQPRVLRRKNCVLHGFSPHRRRPPALRPPSRR